jgi:release factor glutamine methyltransferase
LSRLGSESAARDAKLLVGHVLELSPVQMASGEHDPVSPEQAARVETLLQRRMTGESVARIIGEREFYGLAFGLNEATLEPRPETELLVDLAISRLPPNGRLLDLGTGTGCIPIATLANRPDAVAMATDLSGKALQMAGDNAHLHGAHARIELRQGDWFAALPAQSVFDVIVSNPPYIASPVVETLAPEVKDFDPLLALDGGADGLAPYRIIAAQAARFLKPSGVVLVEIGFDQGETVTALFDRAGFVDVRIHKDLNHLDRVVEAHHLGGVAP